MTTICADLANRILVVDDNPAIHRDFEKIFNLSERNEEMMELEANLFDELTQGTKPIRFEIDSAYQGKDGLALVVKAIKEGRPYSMAFVDVRMPPGWDGIETVSKIWEVNPDLQVVICTAFSDYSWHKMHEILGTSDKLLILKKPFDNLEVLQMASTLTEKWRLQEAMRAHLINMEATVKQRTEQLWASESRFHFLAENVSDLVAIFDAEASPIYLSPSYGGILGFTQEESADLGISGRVHPDDYGIIAGTVERVRSTGVGEWVRFRLSDRKGKWVAIEGRAAVFGSGGGEGFSMLAVGSKGS